MRALKITTQITNRDTIAIEKYLKEISKIPMINHQEEVYLAQRIKQGDKSATNKLVSANLRFVVSTAKKYVNLGLSLNDLINEGNCGLMRAAQDFDETRGFKFITYAVNWIRQSIMEALSRQSRLIRLPSNKRNDYDKILKSYYAFEQEHERIPSEHELAILIGEKESIVKDALQHRQREKSLDAPILEDEDAVYGDFLAANDKADTDVLKDALHQDIRTFLKKLSVQEAEILIASFSLDGEETQLEHIEKKYQLSKERVRKIKERALGRLRNNKQIHVLKTYLG